MIRKWSSKYDKAIGKKIKQWRQDRAMSQQEVSDCCMLKFGYCITQHVISNRENGKSAVSALDFVVLASVLGVAPERALQDLQSVLK